MKIAVYSSADKVFLFFTAITFFALLVILIRRIYYKKKTKSWIFEGPFISKAEFEQKWLGEKGAKNGLKHTDTSGCYVILIYSHDFDGVNFQNYRNVYVGQSVTIHQRVYNHMHGKGCPYLQTDIALQNPMFFRFVPCHRQEMNQFEKQIIWALDATRSYNQRRGGSQRR